MPGRGRGAKRKAAAEPVEGRRLRQRKNDPGRQEEEDKDIWILGDSLPYWVGRRNPDKKTQVMGKTLAWWGIRGMSWQYFQYSLQLDVLLRQPPEVIGIHLGGNDITSHSLKEINKMMTEGINYLKEAFPETKLLWIDILQRLTWGKDKKDNIIFEKKRKRVNRWGRKLIGNDSQILKIDIDIKTPGFFRQDGIHLSDVGLDMYWDALKESLEVLIK